jgi:hypothetical protein
MILMGPFRNGQRPISHPNLLSLVSREVKAAPLSNELSPFGKVLNLQKYYGLSLTYTWQR